MSLLFDKAFFRYLKEDISFGDHFAEKVKRALTELPLKENYFLRYILLGNYDENFLPDYLKKENYEIIRKRLDVIKIVNDGCDNYFRSLDDNSISKFNFTNIFEWVSEDEFESLLREIIRVAQNNAVITYRNLIVPRRHPETLSRCITFDRKLSEKLHNEDLSFIYDNYIVETIIKPEQKWHTMSLEYQTEAS
jgi:S-adenosylmethionine-diacylglycerol 3-amino-3-carboxypropyl transferase